MSKKQKYFLFLFIIIPFFVYSQEYRDPFVSLLPKEEPKKTKEKKEVKEEYISPPEITVEGVLWGTDKPEAIIDGKVYVVGDYLDKETKIYKIEKNEVYILHKGKVFKMTTKHKL